MLEFSTQNKIATYIAIVLTKQNSDQPTLQFFTKNKLRINLRCNSQHKTKFGSTYVWLSHTKQIRINLCCNFPHKTKFEKRALVCEDLFQPRLVSTFGSTYVGFCLQKKKKKNSDQTKLQLSWQNKIRTNLCCNFPQKTKFGLTCVGIFHTKQNCNLCCNFPHKTKFESTYVGLFHTKKKKIRIKLCCNCPDKENSDQPMLSFFLQKKRKFESSYIAIVLTKQNSDQPMLQFSTQNKIRINLCWNFPNKTKFGSTSVGLFSTKKNLDQAILQLSWQNKIRINLYCNFPHKTKFGSTYVAIFHTKQNADQPLLDFFIQKEKNSDQAILQLSCQNKIRINLCCNFPHKTKFGSTYVAIFHPNKIRETCPRMWGPVSAETRKYISNHFRQPRQNSLL